VNIGYLSVVFSHGPAHRSSLNDVEIVIVIRHHLTRLLFLLVFVLLSACATGGTTTASTAASGSGNVITREDLEDLQRLNLYQAVQRLRPQWLQTRGMDSFEQTNEVVVYVDNQQMGGPSELRRLNPVDVGEIRYLDSRQATTQFGRGHPSGAILVFTERGPGGGR
jgi:hypothetical protein